MGCCDRTNSDVLAYWKLSRLGTSIGWIPIFLRELQRMNEIIIIYFLFLTQEEKMFLIWVNSGSDSLHSDLFSLRNRNVAWTRRKVLQGSIKMEKSIETLSIFNAQVYCHQISNFIPFPFSFTGVLGFVFWLEPFGPELLTSLWLPNRLFSSGFRTDFTVLRSRMNFNSRPSSFFMWIYNRIERGAVTAQD